MQCCCAARGALRSLSPILISDFVYVSPVTLRRRISQSHRFARAYGLNAYYKMLLADVANAGNEGQFKILQRLYAVQQADDSQKKITEHITLMMAAMRYWDTRRAMTLGYDPFSPDASANGTPES